MPENVELSTAVPLRREHMPRDFSMSLDRYIGRSELAAGYHEGERRIPASYGAHQSMRGFEETYQNIIDYIVRITYRIWEDREVEYILNTYADCSQVFDDYGLQRGSRKIVADTHHTSGAFSNIRLIADEIVWAGNDEVGFHSSHRTLIRGTNDGASKYGPATGKDVDVLVIANCVAKDNVIFLEHVLYNNSSLLQQLGLDIDRMAFDMASNPPAGWPRDASTWAALQNSARPQQPLHISQPIKGFDVDRFSRDLFQRLWNQKDLEALAQGYNRKFAFQGATGRTFNGREDYAASLSQSGCNRDRTESETAQDSRGHFENRRVLWTCALRQHAGRGFLSTGGERAGAGGGNSDHGDVYDLSSRRDQGGGRARRRNASAPEALSGIVQVILRRVIAHARASNQAAIARASVIEAKDTP